MENKIKVRIERCITNTGWYKNKIGHTFDVINEINEQNGTKYYTLPNSNNCIELQDCRIIPDEVVEWECTQDWHNVFLSGTKYPEKDGYISTPHYRVKPTEFTHHFRKVTPADGGPEPLLRDYISYEDAFKMRDLFDHQRRDYWVRIMTNIANALQPTTTITIGGKEFELTPKELEELKRQIQ
jgi:hypothetical protein